jgi:DNA-binding NarL/FixJ family response regulator
MVDTSRKLRVVVVDDSAVFRRALAEFVALTSGVDVVAEAHDGEEALAAIRQTAPDVVLMDVRMPGLGGLETTRMLKRGASRPSVVLLTLGCCEHLRGPADDAGADGLLSKSDIEDRLPPMLDAIFQTILGTVLETARVAPRADTDGGGGAS